MKILYIKANGEYHEAQERGVQDPKLIEGRNLPVCKINKLMFGRYQVDYYEAAYDTNRSFNSDNGKPNVRLILYPSGIEEVKFKY